MCTLYLFTPLLMYTKRHPITVLRLQMLCIILHLTDIFQQKCSTPEDFLDDTIIIIVEEKIER